MGLELVPKKDHIVLYVIQSAKVVYFLYFLPKIGRFSMDVIDILSQDCQRPTQLTFREKIPLNVSGFVLNN